MWADTKPECECIKVLVVDDYVDNANTLAMLLRLYGYHVDTALGGHAALDQARRSKPDVVLLDIVMPLMNGYEVARQLRQIYQDDVVIVALTANGFEDDRRRSASAGFDLHLVKPTDAHELEQLLDQLAGLR